MRKIVYTRRGQDGRHTAYDATTHQPISAAASGWKSANRLWDWLQSHGYSVTRAPRQSR